MNAVIADTMVANATVACMVTLLTWCGLHRSCNGLIRAGTLHIKSAVTVERVGIAALLASACANLRAGGSLDAALLGRGHRLPMDTTLLGIALARIVERRRLPAESSQQVSKVACELTLAHRLSAVSGCEESRCIEAVAQTHKQSSILDEMRRNAFAMPQATVKLLSILPFATLMLEEFSGARPLTFLFGSIRGVACLLLGMSAYAGGLVWMSLLMRMPPDGSEVVSGVRQPGSHITRVHEHGVA